MELGNAIGNALIIPYPSHTGRAGTRDCEASASKFTCFQRGRSSRLGCRQSGQVLRSFTRPQPSYHGMTEPVSF